VKTKDKSGMHKANKTTDKRKKQKQKTKKRLHENQ